MKDLTVKKFPSSILRKVTKPVSSLSQEDKNLLDDMAKTMYENKGIGLAASQVGIDVRLAVVDIGEGLLKLINPKILKREDTDTTEEGCLSVPDVSVRVKRAKKILVEFMETNGEVTTLETNGLLAKAIQHEIDHLNGRLIIDYLNPLKKFFLKHKLKRHN